MSLEAAIQQQKFNSQHQKVAINILYTASWYSTELSRALKPYGVSWQQFNIMRILRGQKGKPVTLKLVSERMIDRMSNTSRLVDKLVAKNLVERTIDASDRRQVALTLTASGLDLLDRTSKCVEEMGSVMFGHMCNESLGSLNQLLDTLRENRIK